MGRESRVQLCMTDECDDDDDALVCVDGSSAVLTLQHPFKRHARTTKKVHGPASKR
jgi:hypothetical protein